MILNGTRGRKGVYTSQFLSSALHAWNIWVFRSSNKRFLKEIRNLYECEQIYCILNMRNKKKIKRINICLQNISVAFLSMFLVITHFIMINICLQNISVVFLSMFLIITHFIILLLKVFKELSVCCLLLELGESTQLSSFSLLESDN